MNNSESKQKKKNRILFFSHNLALEGATKSLFFLVQGLKKEGYAVKVWSIKNGPLQKWYQREGVPILIGKSGLRREVARDCSVFVVNTVMGYNIIQRNMDSAEKIVWIIRESEKEEYFKKNKDLQKETFSKVSRIIFVSDSTKEVYEELNNSENFITINNGLLLDPIDKYIAENNKNVIKKKYGIEKDQVVVSIIGTLCLRKGQLEFAQAACQVLKNDQAERKVKFLIIGEQKDISYTKRVREVIKEFGYEKEIVLIPETEKINDYYCMTDMFVCNSYIESFPRVILEAMAFSLPIVATNVYGIPEQIRDGKEGLLIMPGDVNDLAKKMELLLERQEKAKEMGQKARERVEKDFTYKKMIKRYEDIIQEVCEAK